MSEGEKCFGKKRAEKGNRDIYEKKGHSERKYMVRVTLEISDSLVESFNVQGLWKCSRDPPPGW
jgi:hypothetical protein